MNKLYLLTLGFAIAAGFAAINYAANDDLRAVRTGEFTLVCVINDEARTIKPSQVAGLMDGIWFFESGHAKNCGVVKGGSR